MKTFSIGENMTAACESQKTRSGFRHVAVLLVNGEEIHRTKICYYNRTWENFEFESVLRKLLEKSSLAKEQKEEFFEQACRKNTGEIDSMFRTVATVAKIGEIFANTKKEKNDWKQRMLKAGLQNLEMPEDWDSLDEDEKETRLDMIIRHLSNGVVGK